MLASQQRECLRKILTANNYEVSEANDIHSALFKINDMEISMYIIDIKLPDGEGIFICKLVKMYFINLKHH